MPASSSKNDDFDVSQVAGNAPDNIKRVLRNPQAFAASIAKPGQKPFVGFARTVQQRLKVTELSINGKAEEPNRLEGRAVLEIEVAEDMVNLGGNIHGDCSAYLIDIASSYALAVLNMYDNDGNLPPSVSQVLNVVYHSPAAMGEKLRLVNTTLTVGKRAESVRTEIWNVTHQRLVASRLLNHPLVRESIHPMNRFSLSNLIFI